jgi:hypothetical protein
MQFFNIGGERMRITSAGNVGIGTASPGQRLTVSGGYISQVDGGVSTFLGYDGTGSLVGTTTNHYLRFITNDTERMRITSGGNLLVGVNATGPYLDGQITSSVPSGTLPAACFKNLTSTQFVASFWNSASSGDNVFQMFVTDSSPTIRGTISYNRAAGLVAYNTTSDYRLKTEIEDFEALSIIKNLKPKEFRVLDSENKSIGFIAHELQEFYPQAVTGEKDAVDEEGNPKYQGVDYSQLTGLLVKAIQELKAEIDSLKTK